MPRIKYRTFLTDILISILGAFIWVALLLGALALILPAHGGDIINYGPPLRPAQPQQIIVAEAPEYRLSKLSAMTPSEREQYYFLIFIKNQPVYRVWTPYPVIRGGRR